MRLESGKYLVKKAREIITAFLNSKPLPEVKGFPKKQGVFVTLKTYPGMELRGCIGFPDPILPLNDALKQAAIAAAVKDPRFTPLNSDELNKIVVEVSVLTPPKKIEGSPKARPKKIEIGKDGLIVKCGPYAGLLLPQVATEWKWDSETFLCQTCAKAGLSLSFWLDERSEVYKFQAHILSEKEPNGEVVKS